MKLKSILVVLALLTSTCMNVAYGQTTKMVNPLTYTDIPDNDVIRVGDDFYMVSTTMFMCPGAPIMHSKDLVHWRIISYIYDYIADDDIYNLRNGKDAYGKGQWATTLRYHNGVYYALFIANDQHKTYVYRTTDITKSYWERNEIEGAFFHDASLLFDNDGKVYLYHVRLQEGNRIFVAEMTDDLSGIKEETAKECVSATLPWENAAKAGWSVAEGPTVLHIGDTYYLFYSANSYTDIDYAVGVATAPSPYGPWTKSDQSVINRANIGHYGTGHGDMFKDAQGHWNYVFHTHNSLTEVQPRKTAIVGLSQQGHTFSVEEGTFHYLCK